MSPPLRLAWFSPLPPVRSGVAAYSAEVLPHLRRDHAVDCFIDEAARVDNACDAHDFVWRHRRQPYDLVVYQLGNAPCHDYMWAYLAAYPGLVVLHDARLHHARAGGLLSANRAEDYRAEFRFDHPDAVQDFAEYAVEGLSGPIYYFWPMLRVVMSTARTIANHNVRVAAALREEYPAAAIEMIRMGVPGSGSPEDAIDARTRVRRELAIPEDAPVFVAFGKMTAEKRIGEILRAFSALVAEGVHAFLLLVGDDGEYRTLERDAGGTDRVRVTGYVEHDAIGAYLAAADVCLCLRWPTALETSASWLRCLAARRATVITDLPHLVDVPGADPRTWRATHPAREPVAVAIDLLDEDRSLLLAMRRLAADAALRETLARAGHEYWLREHTLDAMAADYRRVIAAAVARPAPEPRGLPAHFTEDHSEAARLIARRFGQQVDILGSG
jgi:glycosyltransferase involved in cell wall biosynthesis